MNLGNNLNEIIYHLPICSKEFTMVSNYLYFCVDEIIFEPVFNQLDVEIKQKMEWI